MKRPLILILASCLLVGTGRLETPSAEAARNDGQADPIKADRPVQVRDTTHALGDSIYHNWCNSCHTLYPPQTKPASAWFSTVRKMQDVARGAGRDTLTRIQMFAVVDYLEAQADTTGGG